MVYHFFFGFWLIGWAIGEFVVLGLIIGGLIGLIPMEKPPSSPAALGMGSIFIFAWLGGWTTFGVFAIYTFLWQIVGKEIVEVSRQSIILVKKVLRFGRQKEYAAQYIKDLRIATPNVSHWFGWDRANSFWGTGGGTISFDYGARTYRFGNGLDEAEAKQIL